MLWKMVPTAKERRHGFPLHWTCQAVLLMRVRFKWPHQGQSQSSTPQKRARSW